MFTVAADRPRWAAWAFLACALCGCSGVERDALALHAIEPSRVTTLVETPAVLRGLHFDDAISELDLSSGTAPHIDRRWRVRLGEHEAEGVERRDAETLQLTVPAGLEPGTYSVRAISPSGASAELPDALSVSASPVGLRLQIESEADGSGQPIAERALIAGESLALFAVFRTADGAFVSGDIDVRWQATELVGALRDESAAHTTFASERTGTALVTAEHEETGSSEPATLRVRAGDASGLAIEDAAEGTGRAIDVPRTLTTDDALQLYAVSRDRFGNFVADVAARWSVSGGIGNVDADGSLELTRPGVGRVRAEHALGNAETAELTVSAGRAAELAFEPSQATLTAGDSALALSLRARDADGNETSDLGELRWEVLGGPMSSLDAAARSFAPALAGEQRVRVESSHGPSAELALHVRAGRAVRLQLSAPATAFTAGDAAVMLAVSGEDAFGNATSDLGALQFSMAGSLRPADLDAQSGVLTPRGAGTGRAVVTSSYGPSAESEELSIAAGRATALGLTPASAMLSADDAPLGFALSGSDAFGNATADLGAISWSIARGPIGTLSANGVLDPKSAGVGAVRAQSAYGPSVDSGDVTIVAGRAATLVVSPQTLTISADAAPYTFSATGSDADGNPTFSLGSLTWSIESGPIGAIDAALGQLDPKGAGTGVVRVESQYGVIARTSAVTITPGLATRVVLAPDTLTISADAAPVAFSTTGYDADDNPTSSLGTLSYSIASGPISQLDAASGTLDPVTAGSGTLRVTSSLGPTDLSGTITIQPGRAASLTVAPGSLTTRVGGAASSFSASGTDADGNATTDVGALSYSVSSGAFGTLDTATGKLTPNQAGAGIVRVSNTYGAAADSGAVVVHPPFAPVSISSLTVPTGATRGQGAAVVDVTVTNGVADREARITSIWFELARSGSSVTSEYTLRADGANPDRIAPSSSATLRFYLDVSSSATWGTIDLTANLAGYVNGYAAVSDTRSASFDVFWWSGPVAKISAPAQPNDRICAGGTVSFDGRTSTGSGLSYAWSFSSGTPASSTASAPSNIAFATPGHYDYRLTVRDTNGNSDSVRGVMPIFVGRAEAVASATYPTGRVTFEKPAAGGSLDLGVLPSDKEFKTFGDPSKSLRQCDGTPVAATGDRFVTVWVDRGVIDPAADVRTDLPGFQVALAQGGLAFDTLNLLRDPVHAEGSALVYAEYYNAGLGTVTAAGYQSFRTTKDKLVPSLAQGRPASDCGNCWGPAWPFVFQFSEPLDAAALSGVVVRYNATLSCSTGTWFNVTGSSNVFYDAAARALYVRAPAYGGMYTISVQLGGLQDTASAPNVLPSATRCVFVGPRANAAVPLPPSLLSVSADPFSPDGDGLADSTQLDVQVDAETRVARLAIARGASDVITLLAFANGAGSLSFMWDGRDVTGRVVPDGVYSYELSAENAEGERSEAVSGAIEVDSAVHFIGVPSRY
ncbi:MAG TPA: PKD domain-containing protein [Polyangiales bacterium]|nr:PKD domain-containing protein [Polyangiales bacterium]